MVGNPYIDALHQRCDGRGRAATLFGRPFGAETSLRSPHTALYIARRSRPVPIDSLRFAPSGLRTEREGGGGGCSSFRTMTCRSFPTRFGGRETGRHGVPTPASPARLQSLLLPFPNRRPRLNSPR